MKRTLSFLSIILFFAVSCVPTFEEVGDLPDNPGIKEILVGNENGKIAQENAIYPDANIDTVWVKDKSADFSNVYLNANLQPGCTVEPLEGSTPFGEYGDFSTPQNYRVTAPTGNSADWTVVLDYYVPPVGCLADRWVGDVVCEDVIYPSYSPATCTGEKIDDDCQRINISFNFWADASAPMTLELQLGDIDMDTFTGTVTLLNDVNVTSYGADMTFSAGEVGTYNATSNELHLSIGFSGYDIGGGPYEFTIKQGS
jgi:hypothetical protein